MRRVPSSTYRLQLSADFTFADAQELLSRLSINDVHTWPIGTSKHLVAKPGDRIPITGLDWRIVTSAGQVLKTPLPGGGRPNPACASFEKRPDPATPDDNAASVGSVVTYGQFRLIDLGDLLWNKEGELMCPSNPIGTAA